MTRHMAIGAFTAVSVTIVTAVAALAYFSQQSATPTAFTSQRAAGYPELVGFDGVSLLLTGSRPHMPYSLLSEQQHQVNMISGLLLPTSEFPDLWVLGLSLRYNTTTLSIQLKDVQETLLEKYYDPNAHHDTKQRMRYNGPLHELLHVEVDGNPLNIRPQDLPQGGLAVMTEPVIIYFPGPETVNPDDAPDRPIVVFKTPDMEYTIYLESEEHLHLDIKTTIVGDRPLQMHGLMGQTIIWRGTDYRKGMTKQQLHDTTEGSLSDYVLKDGFTGTDFKYSLFRTAERQAVPDTRVTKMPEVGHIGAIAGIRSGVLRARKLLQTVLAYPLA